MRLTRRELIAAGGGVVAVVLLPACGSHNRLLKQWFGKGNLGFMRHLGDLYAEQLEDSGGSIEDELDAIEPGGGEQNDEVLVRWQLALDDDLDVGEMAVVGGFCLGLTEARICLLAAHG